VGETPPVCEFTGIPGMPGYDGDCPGKLPRLEARHGASRAARLRAETRPAAWHLKTRIRRRLPTGLSRERIGIWLHTGIRLAIRAKTGCPSGPMAPGFAPPSLARRRSAAFMFCCPAFDPAPPAPGNALTPDSALTDDCTADDDASLGSNGFFGLFSTESVSMPF